MFRAFLLIILVGASTWVFADFLDPAPGDSPMTEIQRADLICESKGAKFAFDTTAGQEKIWQSDPGSSEGIELTVTFFQRLQCPYCFDIGAEITMFGETVKYKISTREISSSSAANRVQFVLEIIGSQDTLVMDCHN